MATGQEIIDGYHDKLDSLKEKIDKSSEEIIKVIDLNKLLENPQQYLESIARQYYESHVPELKKAIKIGEEEAKGILKKYCKT